MSGDTEKPSFVPEGELVYSIEKQILWNENHINEMDSYEPEKAKFLVVEDDPVTQKILKEFVQSTYRDVECLTAESAVQALKILDNNQIDLVICDYFLEGHYTGLDLWHSAVALYPETEFVITSTMNLPKYLDIVSGIRYPPNFIPKPVEFESWKKLIDETNAGGKYEKSYQ